MWVHFNTDETVVSAGLVVNGAKRVRGHADVLYFNLLEQNRWLGPRILPQNLIDGRVVLITARDRLVENCRITGNTTDAILLDQSFQLTRSNQVPPHVIQ